jgi:hypothetical protein
MSTIGLVAELCAVDLNSSHQFEEEIVDSSPENRLFIPKMEFSVRTEAGPDTIRSRELAFRFKF